MYLRPAPHGPGFCWRRSRVSGRRHRVEGVLGTNPVSFLGDCDKETAVKIIRARTSLKQKGFSQKLAKRLRKATLQVAERLEAYVPRGPSRP